MTNHQKESCLFVGVGDDKHGKIYKASKSKEREEDAIYVMVPVYPQAHFEMIVS